MNGGGNFIDTAESYSAGHRNAFWQSLDARAQEPRSPDYRDQSRKRDREPMSTPRGLSRQHILNELDASLNRLQTGILISIKRTAMITHRLHLRELSRPSLTSSTGQSALHRSFQLQCCPSARRHCEISEQHHYARYAAMPTSPYHLLNRAQYERELEPLCLTQGLGVITYSSLASGFLTGKYRQGQDVPSSPRAKQFKNSI